MNVISIYFSLLYIIYFSVLYSFIKLNAQVSSVNRLRLALASLIVFPISTKHDVEVGNIVMLYPALSAY